MSHSINSEPHPAGRVVAVAGEADAHASPDLDDALRGAIVDVVASDSGRTIIVDLSEASFVDSRTIGVLVNWAEQLAQKGWRMPIVCSDPDLLRLFATIGLQQTFEFFETRETAAADGPGGRR